MPEKYATVIDGIVSADRKVKPRLVYSMMLSQLGIREEQKPNDTPSHVQVTRKVGTVKERLKRQLQSGT